jgi:hypothetical protein
MTGGETTLVIVSLKDYPKKPRFEFPTPKF